MRTAALLTWSMLVCALTGRADAQATPLGSALSVRRAPTELVPQVCPAAETWSYDFVCARSESGVVTAFRRVGMRGGVGAARRGDDLYFAAADDNTQTRFADHVWRWDLARDEIHGLGEMGSHDGERVLFVVAASFDGGHRAARRRGRTGRRRAGRHLLAQRDDGTYFLADRSLEPSFVVRLGPSLLEAPTVPRASRPDLYRPTLVEDFFAGR